MKPSCPPFAPFLIVGCLLTLFLIIKIQDYESAAGITMGAIAAVCFLCAALIIMRMIDKK